MWRVWNSWALAGAPSCQISPDGVSSPRLADLLTVYVSLCCDLTSLPSSIHLVQAFLGYRTFRLCRFHASDA